jgi:small subunit ribosomal protein S3
MAVERKFVNGAMKKVKIDRYVRGELSRVGCGDVEVTRTPLGTRVTIHAMKPGLVIGRKGKNIQMLTDTLRDRFKIENPQIEVQEVTVPELDPEIMSKQLAGTLERGIHFRRAAYSMIQSIMKAGALGVQLEISGKISGSRARKEKFKAGYIKHCGETANLYVKEATTQAYLKPGVIGIKVKIVPPSESGLFKELNIKEIVQKPEEKKEGDEKMPEPKVKEVTEEIKKEAEKEKKIKEIKQKAEELGKKVVKKKEKKKEEKKPKKKAKSKAVKAKSGGKTHAKKAHK